MKTKQERERTRRKRAPRGRVLPILTFAALDTSPSREATPADRQVALDLAATARATKNAAGLAAPQIGHHVRMIVLSPRGQTPLVMVNPEIVRHGQIPLVGVERCLSYPGLSKVIERWQVVDVTYASPEAMDRRLVCTFTGPEARIVQHEIDHLCGLCQVAEKNR